MHNAFCLLIVLLCVLESHSRNITFAGYDSWVVKSGNEMGPGPNNWCDSESCVWLDSNKAVHLTSFKSSTEITLEGVYVGYGTYYMVVQGDFNNMDPYTVFGAFTYDLKGDSAPGYGEVDFEFSKWGNPQKRDIASYAIHPVTEPQKTAQLPANGIYTLVLIWSVGKTYQRSYVGRVPFDKINKVTPFMQLEYTGLNAKTSPPSTTEFHFNLWQYQGRASPKKIEAAILDFKYTPGPGPVPPPDPVSNCRKLVMLDTNEQCSLCCTSH